ncbi:hypothetical protein SAMN05192551_105141 [Tindallia magadiensis]|uniref:Uncharacterized protein n=1 Tax=Tindallia magadiensis TaxID=69895 RepID=A0A1I3ES44_9FIRM|nr:hypothetical protein SAMN05192551_105141 [Tindallia magadiensis]
MRCEEIKRKTNGFVREENERMRMEMGKKQRENEIFK